MQTQRVRYKEVHLLPHQAAALRSKSRFIGLIGGTGGGKSFTIPWWLFAEIQNHPKDEYIVAAPTYKMLTRATVPIIRDAYRDTDLEGEYKPSYNVYLLPTGGKIWFGTADRPESLEAGQYRAACLDEAGQMKYMAWIQARLGMKEGRALLTTTPYGLNWLYHEFYLHWKKDDPNYDVINFSSIDNPYYPAREFERAKRDLSESLFAMRFIQTLTQTILLKKSLKYQMIGSSSAAQISASIILMPMRRVLSLRMIYSTSMMSCMSHIHC